MTRPGGFTLIEVLVAITITLGVSAVLVSLTSATLSTWHRAQSAFTTDAEARLVLDTLGRDLQAVAFRENGATWLAVDVIPSPATLANHGWRVSGAIKPSTSESLVLLPPAVGTTPSSLADARFGLSGAWLRFLTTNFESKNSSNPGGSLPIAVSYQIARRPVSGSMSAANPAAVRYTLFRSAVANDTTLATGLDVSAAAYASGLTAFPGARSARSLTNPSASDAIASNVIDFGVWLYARTAMGELQRIYPTTGADLTHAVISAPDQPVVADVMIRVLTLEGAKEISLLESGGPVLARPESLSDAEWWWSVANAHSRVYLRRIQLRVGT